MPTHVKKEEGHIAKICNCFHELSAKFSIGKADEDLKVTVPSTICKRSVEGNLIFLPGTVGVVFCKLFAGLADRLPILEKFRHAPHHRSSENGHSPIES
jgi:hypothetical protein